MGHIQKNYSDQSALYKSYLRFIYSYRLIFDSFICLIYIAPNIIQRDYG